VQELGRRCPEQRIAAVDQDATIIKRATKSKPCEAMQASAA